MANKQLIVDISKIDFNNVIADVHEIRKYNRQRYEMEQLTAVVYLSKDPYAGVGYKDTSQEDFWVRGHMPGLPIMPGIVMLEAVAQLSSFVTQRFDLLGAAMVGFGGVEDVRFRDPVLPGDRLILISELMRVRRHRMIICKFQGIVRDTIVVEGIVKGVPIPVEAVAMLQKNRPANTP